MTPKGKGMPMGAHRAGRGVVAALCLTSFAPLSLGLSCAGIFYPALSADLGVSAGLLSYYTSALWVAALVTLPLLGRLFTFAGPRWCVTGASFLIAVDFVALSFTRGLAWFLGCGLVMGVGVAMLLFLAPSTLVNRWFSKRAGVLLGVVMAFAGIGGAVWCAVGGVVIDQGGWRIAYRLFAVLSLVLGAVPAALLVRDAPQELVEEDAADDGEGAACEAEGVAESAAPPVTFAVPESVLATPTAGSPDPAHASDPTRASAPASESASASAPAPAPRWHRRLRRHPYLPFRRTDGATDPAAPIAQLSPDVSLRVAALREKIPQPARTDDEGGSGATAHPLPTEMGVPARRALPSGLLMLIADIAFILNFGMFVYFIIPSFAQSAPAAATFPVLGAIASSVAMVGQTVSKVALGFVGDRAPAAGAAAGIVFGIVGIAVLWFFSGSVALVLAGAFLFGAYYGVANVMMPLFTRLGFGMRDYPRIYARVSMAASLGAIVSGILWGTVIGATGGYAELFAGVTILLVVALALVYALARRLVR